MRKLRGLRPPRHHRACDLRSCVASAAVAHSRICDPALRYYRVSRTSRYRTTLLSSTGDRGALVASSLKRDVGTMSAIAVYDSNLPPALLNVIVPYIGISDSIANVWIRQEMVPND
jgi:hypothetical protein